MPKNRQHQHQSVLVFWLFGAVMAGVACIRWIPSDWFLSLLGYSILVDLIVAVLAIWDLKSERRAPVPIALVFEVLWLPSRNGEIKFGPLLWAFFMVTGFVAGMLFYALLLPIFL